MKYRHSKWLMTVGRKMGIDDYDSIERSTHYKELTIKGVHTIFAFSICTVDVK
jgi:hypothetical protein